MLTIIIIVDAHVSRCCVHDLVRICRKSFLVGRWQEVALFLQLSNQLQGHGNEIKALSSITPYTVCWYHLALSGLVLSYISDLLNPQISSLSLSFSDLKLVSNPPSGLKHKGVVNPLLLRLKGRFYSMTSKPGLTICVTCYSLAITLKVVQHFGMSVVLICDS